MARKSRWANFAESFNGTYGALNSAFRNIQMGRAMSADYDDDEGNALTGDALDRARYRALADIETRYGRAAEGLALRSNQAALQATNFENDLNVELRPELLRQRGVLQSGLMEAQTSQANASAANSYSLANERDTLLPGRVEGQGLTNAGLALDNAQAEFDLELARETRPASVEAANAEASKASADARLSSANADVAEATVGSRVGTSISEQRKALSEANVATGTERARVSRATSEAENAASVAGTNAIALDEARATYDQRIDTSLAEMRAAAATAAATEGAAQDTVQDRNIMAGIFQEATTRGFESESAATAWMMEQMNSSAMSAAGRLQYATTVREFGLERLMTQAATVSEQAVTAYRDEGLSGLVDQLYNTRVNDGQTGRWETAGGVTRVIVTDDATGAERVVAEASGVGAQERIGSQLLSWVANPMGGMEIAAAVNAYERDRVGLQQDQANVDRTEAQTRLTDAQTQQVASSINVDQARIRQLESSIRVDDARVTQLVAQTAGQLLENDAFLPQFEANLENIRSQIDSRGIASQLDEAQMTLVAAQVTKIEADVARQDPNRPMSVRERTEFLDTQFTSILRNALSLGPDMTEAEIMEMRRLFEASMMPQGITVTPN